MTLSVSILSIAIHLLLLMVAHMQRLWVVYSALSLRSERLSARLGVVWGYVLHVQEAVCGLRRKCWKSLAPLIPSEPPIVAPR